MARSMAARPSPTSLARLQLTLVALAAWNLLTFLLELINASALRVGDVDGVLGARSVSGATAVLALAYLYAARNPLRHRLVLWLALLEQLIALFAATFHWARGDVAAGEALVPVAAAAMFLVLLIANMPRQTDTI